MSEREQARKIDELLHGWDTAAWEATIGMTSKRRHAVRMALASYRDALEAALDREERYERGLKRIASMPTSERNPDGDEQAAHSMQLVAQETLSSPAEPDKEQG